MRAELGQVLEAVAVQWQAMPVVECPRTSNDGCLQLQHCCDDHRLAFFFNLCNTVVSDGRLQLRHFCDDQRLVSSFNLHNTVVSGGWWNACWLGMVLFLQFCFNHLYTMVSGQRCHNVMVAVAHLVSSISHNISYNGVK
ncbi:uncharacterized protein LOC127809730 [Diospyros lotus]|uniref:uncharacterized protein LOC127809730 n=1 Tax=Diospyros lotus TaxID=55363 RepID=UPI0022525F08|nr:uncharacterized protein LOC127809730 [Diospyros lotus]